MTTYPIVEHFKTFQGEGHHTGRQIFLIRLFGCPVGCHWCDAAYTWNTHSIPASVPKLTATDIAHKAKTSGAKTVMITGGEPMIHNLDPLTKALKDNNMTLHVETCGGFPLSGTWDWITVSPKWRKLPLKEALEAASELKWIIDEKNALEKWQTFFKNKNGKWKWIWLHPEFSIRHHPDILKTITDCVKQHGDPYRAGWQTHQLYHADPPPPPPKQPPPTP